MHIMKFVPSFVLFFQQSFGQVQMSALLFLRESVVGFSVPDGFHVFLRHLLGRALLSGQTPLQFLRPPGDRPRRPRHGQRRLGFFRRQQRRRISLLPRLSERRLCGRRPRRLFEDERRHRPERLPGRAGNERPEVLQRLQQENNLSPLQRPRLSFRQTALASLLQEQAFVLRHPGDPTVRYNCAVVNKNFLQVTRCSLTCCDRPSRESFETVAIDDRLCGRRYRHRNC